MSETDSASHQADPHRRARLSAGQITDGTLRCAYHGWQFTPDGRCAKIPALEDTAAHALLFVGAEGEAFASPQQRPAIELWRAGERRILFEAESAAAGPQAAAHCGVDARATSRWTAQALEGKAPLPAPLGNLLACCLYAAGYCDDFNQSKAIVAVRAHAPAAA